METALLFLPELVLLPYPTFCKPFGFIFSNFLELAGLKLPVSSASLHGLMLKFFSTATNVNWK